jgi:citrate lyase subunit beta/citryl-CoA lyase
MLLSPSLDARRGALNRSPTAFRRDILCAFNKGSAALNQENTTNTVVQLALMRGLLWRVPCRYGYHGRDRGDATTMRSKLFVPGARPDFFAKALASDADAISFDLEDSVTEDGKDAARGAVAGFLLSDKTRDAIASSGKRIIVRVNALGSSHFAADIAALALPDVALINLPKLHDPADVVTVATALEQAERAAGITRPIGLLVTIETPRALRRAAEIATAHPRVAGLQLGLNDLFEALAIDRQAPGNAHAVMLAMRLASGEGGAFAYDSAYPAIDDDAGFRREAEQARALGYLGKSCIHPRQVAIANALFGTQADALDEARRIIAAADKAALDGHGAFQFDGRMIDRPAIERARAQLAVAEKR